MSAQIQRIVIVGGGLAGWTAACGFVNSLAGLPLRIVVIEMPGQLNIEPTQYTLPETLDFFRHLGIDEGELIRRGAVTFRLGTAMYDWPARGNVRVRGYGGYGGMIGFIPFHHYATKIRLAGDRTDFGTWSLGATAARLGRFARGVAEYGGPGLAYGMQLNTDKLIELLRTNATLNGVDILAENVVSVDLAGDSGRVDSLRLADGRRISGDLYVDASGDAAILADTALEIEFIDWSQWLPCDRTASITVRNNKDKTPLVSVSATEEGWLIESSLRHRIARQLLYPAARVEEARAADRLTEGLDAACADALTFGGSASGHRRRFWSGNCLLLGDCAGRVESLEVSGFHLVQSAVLRFLRHFPSLRFEPRLAEEYNRQTRAEYEAWRDYVLVNYVAVRGRGPGCLATDGTVDLPDTLASRLELFRSRGRFMTADDDGPDRNTWVAMLLSADLWPKAYDPLLDAMNESELNTHFAEVRRRIEAAARTLPRHGEYLAGLSA